VAARALGGDRAGAKTAVPNLVQALNDSNAKVREEVIAALRYIDEKAAREAGL